MVGDPFPPWGGGVGGSGCPPPPEEGGVATRPFEVRPKILVVFWVKFFATPNFLCPPGPTPPPLGGGLRRSLVSVLVCMIACGTIDSITPHKKDVHVRSKYNYLIEVHPCSEEAKVHQKKANKYVKLCMSQVELHPHPAREMSVLQVDR